MATEGDEEDQYEESKQQPSVSINTINVDRLETEDDGYMRFSDQDRAGGGRREGAS